MNKQKEGIRQVAKTYRSKSKYLGINTIFVKLVCILLCVLLCLFCFPVYAVEELTTEEQIATEAIENNDEQKESSDNIEDTIKNIKEEEIEEKNVEEENPKEEKVKEEKVEKKLNRVEESESSENEGPQLIYELSRTCNNCNIIITNEEGFDKNTELYIEDYDKNSSSYDKYINESIDFTNRASNLTYGKVLYMSLLLDNNEINFKGSVNVTISLDENLTDADLIYFEKNNEIPSIIESKINGTQINFKADSLNTYVILSGPNSDSLNSKKSEESNKEDINSEILEKEPKVKSEIFNTKSPHSSHESTNLEDFLTNVTIVGAIQNPEGAYSVEQNQEYELICSFSENSTHQFDNDSILTYQLPNGITILEEQTGQMEINIVYKGRTYQVDTYYDLDTNGQLSIHFDQDDPDYLRLVESTNVSFRFSYHASFDGSETHLHFSDNIERDLIFTDPEPGEAYVTKTGWFDEETGIFYYTIKITAHGDVDDVNVKDELLGNALVFNNDVIVSGNSSSYVDNGSTTGFNYTFASMREGEEITITYSANVNFEADQDNDGRITADQTKNSVTVDPDPGSPHVSEYSREIHYKYTIKNPGIENNTTSNGDKIIDWSIDYNPLALAPVGGDTITDTIASDSTDYMTYYGSGIIVEVKDHNGNIIRTDDIPYNNLSAYSGSSWTYTIPTEDTQPYSYHITYQTIVNMEEVEGEGSEVILNNDANGSSNSIGIIPNNAIVVDKEVESHTTEEINWITTFTIPEHGLTSAIVTDTLPARYFEGRMHYDVFDPDSLDITGLLTGENYNVTVGTGVVTITFYYTENNEIVEGLKPCPGGRNIYLKLTTKTDQDWLDLGYEDKSYETHMNTIYLNHAYDTAYVIYGKPGIEKTGELMSDGTFKYTLIIDGLESDHIDISDTFDRDLLEVDTSKTGQPDHMYMYGGTQWAQIWGKTPVSYTDTADGMNLTVNNVAKDEHDQYYAYYMISYYLKLKDGVDLDALAKAHGGKYDIDNTVIWGDYESTFTYKVRYNYLTKELLNEEELGGTNRVAKYRITFNSDKVTLNSGNPIEMTDILSANLSIDYSSVNIMTDPEGINIPYVLKGGRDENNEPDGTTVATYTIPDHTKVIIEYDAFVRGNGVQTITNTVSALEDKKNVVSIKEYGALSEGEGAIASFKIVKVDGYDANKKLSGVKFKVYAANDELDFGENHDYAKEIILETDENGEIIFDGDQYDFYFDELYYVEEIDPPPGYGRLDTIYNVTLTSDMSSVNYGRYIYYYNDSMQIKNYPLEGLVVEKKVDSNYIPDKTRTYLFRVSILNNDGTVNTNYNEGNDDYQFVNGIYEFQLKDGQQRMFGGFLKGTKYKVEELDAEGFITSITYTIYDEEGNVTQTNTNLGIEHIGTLTQAEELIIFTNSKPNILVPTGGRYTGYSLEWLFIFSSLILLIIFGRKLQIYKEKRIQNGL